MLAGFRVLLDLVASLAKMELLHVQRFQLDKELIHDCATTTHARGHADPQFLREYPRVLPAAGLAFRSPLPAISGRSGPRQHPNLSGLSDEREEARAWL